MVGQRQNVGAVEKIEEARLRNSERILYRRDACWSTLPVGACRWLIGKMLASVEEDAKEDMIIACCSTFHRASVRKLSVINCNIFNVKY